MGSLISSTRLEISAVALSFHSSIRMFLILYVLQTCRMQFQKHFRIYAFAYTINMRSEHGSFRKVPILVEVYCQRYQKEFLIVPVLLCLPP